MNRRKIDWRAQAKAQLRALAHFAATGEGDVKRFRTSSRPSSAFALATTGTASHDDGQTLYVTAVKLRREAYR